MKRILVVLTLLAVCSMGFSVSGKVYGRLLPSTTVNTVRGWYAGENGWGLPLDDLRVGRQGTGVSVNFDSFTLDYKLRAPLNGGNDGVLGGLVSVYSNALTGTTVGAGANLQATSPGYFQLSGLKLGPLDLGIGLSWWTLGQSVAALTTNGAGVTNTYAAGSIGYNLVALDLMYNFQAGDIRFHADPWNKADFYFYGGGLNLVTGAASANTNTVTGGGYKVFFPLNIDYSMEAFSITIETKFGFNGMSGSAIINAGTNTATASGFQAGGVAKIGYVVNELVAIFAGAGIEVNGSDTVGISGATTNEVKVNNMFAPLMGGITLSPSPALTFNLGIGYNVVISGETLDTTLPVTNSDTFPESRFQSEWDTYEMHGYWHPLIKFAANTKFAGDFSAGLVYIVMLNEPNGAGGNGGYRDQNSHTKFGYSRVGNWLNFVNIPDFDPYGGSCAYLGYAKDNFEIKGWIGNETALAGLFSAIDFTIKY